MDACRAGRWFVVGAAVFAVLTAGCDRFGGKDKGSDDDDDGPSRKKSVVVERDESSTGVARPTPAQPPASSPPTAQAGGRSPVPTVAEWDAVTREVTVPGSSALNCETKMVREWLRVSCRGKNRSGGTATGVTITAGGGRGDDFTFFGSEVASLVVRFVVGVDLQARFSWTDRNHVLRVWWPRGAPEPPSKGEFLGAPAAGAAARVPSGSAGPACGCPAGTFCCYGRFNELWCGSDAACPTG